MRRPSFTSLRLIAATLLLATPSWAQLSTPEPGYERAGATSFAHYCGRSTSRASLSDGTFVIFDGLDVEHRTAGGFLIQRLASFPFFTFPGFVSIHPDETIAYVGESSNGAIFEVDLAGGGANQIATLEFNFDMAFDPATPDSAYISAATSGFGVNSVHRIDLTTGATEEVVLVTGFSGPLAVNDFGDVLLARLPASFPFPVGATDILLFDNASLYSGAVLDESASTVLTSGLDGASSIAFDHGKEQFFLAETNTGATGAGTNIWRLDAAGVIQEKVTASTVFATGLELIDHGIGTAFGPYQPNYSGLRFTESDCFGPTAISDRVDLAGARPSNRFSGPMIGMSGMADYTITGGPPNGFASLWLARSSAFLIADTVTPMGGAFPIALRANPSEYIRRFPMIQLDASGSATFSFFQDVSFEGAAIAQWIVFDPSMAPLTSTNVQVNRSSF